MTKRNPNARRNRAGLTRTEVKDLATQTHKHCSMCGDFKPAEDYSPDPRGLLGKVPQCRACWRAYSNNRNQRPDIKAKRKKYDQTPERKRKIRLAFVRKTYGEEAMEIEQRRLAGEPCDICGGKTKNMVIDHCHASERARGLLCNNCNVTLGRSNDDPELLRALAAYLEKNGS